MTWRGTVRSIQAASRRAEREAHRRQRELESERRQYTKMQELQRAAYEVQVHENHIDLLSSIHKECGDWWDWEAIHSEGSPERPTQHRNNEEAANSILERYSPGLLDKLFRRIASKHANLTQAVEKAREQDAAEYQAALKEYELDFKDWEDTRDLAKRILDGDTTAYLQALEEAEPLDEISNLGSSLTFTVIDKTILEATLHVNDEEVIPKETKSLLRSGKLSSKQMPKGRFYELYQDYICSCALRVASEIIALLPIEMVIVNAMGNLLNTQTGHLEEQPVLSVAMPRNTLSELNTKTLDPSDSMHNFVHNMDFRKTTGFRAVNKVDPTTFQRTA